MDDLLESISKSMIEKAMERVVHHFEFSTKVPFATANFNELVQLAEKEPVEGPCGLIIRAHTKENSDSAINILSSIVRLLTNTGLIEQKSLRQFHFDRDSSFEETIEVFVIGLGD